MGGPFSFRRFCAAFGGTRRAPAPALGAFCSARQSQILLVWSQLSGGAFEYFCKEEDGQGQGRIVLIAWFLRRAGAKWGPYCCNAAVRLPMSGANSQVYR